MKPSTTTEEPLTVDLDWDLLYTRYPHRYDTFSEHQDGDDRLVPRIDELVGGLAGKTVLDIGGGTGRYARRLRQEGATVICAEPCEPMLRLAETRSRELGDMDTRFLLAPAQSLPLPDGCVDIVLAAHSLNAVAAREVDPQGGWRSLPHVTRYQEKKRAVDELLRTLREGGWLFSLASSPTGYGGELCETILGDRLAEWSTGKRYFLTWLETEYGAVSETIDADWVFADPEEASRVFGFVYGRAVIDHIRAAAMSRIANPLVLQHVRKLPAGPTPDRREHR